MDRVVLRPRERADDTAPAFVDASFLPSRGMSLHHARARLPNRAMVDLVDGALSFAGAILLPFANRIRGRLESGGTTLETSVLGRRVHLPANWHGQQPGAEKCAMHGLLFDRPMRVAESGPDYVLAVLDAGDFDCHWPSRTYVQATATLSATPGVVGNGTEYRPRTAADWNRLAPVLHNPERRSPARAPAHSSGSPRAGHEL